MVEVDSPSSCHVNKLAKLLPAQLASQRHLSWFLYYLFLIGMFLPNTWEGKTDWSALRVSQSKHILVNTTRTTSAITYIFGAVVTLEQQMMLNLVFQIIYSHSIAQSLLKTNSAAGFEAFWDEYIVSVLPSSDTCCKTWFVHQSLPKWSWKNIQISPSKDKCSHDSNKYVNKTLTGAVHKHWPVHRTGM